MSILGLDIGDKRTGVAISNDVSSICTPLNYIPSQDINYFLENLSILIIENKINKLIIGLPKLLSGKEGERAKYSRYISKKIKEKNKNVEIVLWDERLTSKQAEKYLIESGVEKNKMKEKIDSASAVIILESYILGQSR
ncbi:MAG: Holliday junction resolvase RuvX [Chloroflexi bacterium]|jgi:putative Holliday junction resolvase|nr:Holliday junction resolvase RuvX [Chloroflexota bacterium]|tara:strand:- start:1010 stop:1426 length:417 start_codon:yes stop_codon:yes gene_type:complete